MNAATAVAAAAVSGGQSQQMPPVAPPLQTPGGTAGVGVSAAPPFAPTGQGKGEHSVPYDHP